MQNPVGAVFNFETMRMEMTSFLEAVLNPDAQNKFVHTVSAGYVAGSMFVLSISSWYILRKQDVEFAKKASRIAAAFGMAAILSVLVLGDESGYSIGKAQKTKMAALEAMWKPSLHRLRLICLPFRMKRNAQRICHSYSLCNGHHRHALARYADSGY